MFGPPGVAYVYLVYGMYECLNVVTRPEGTPSAVLVRAVEPIDGVELMREARIDRPRGAGVTLPSAEATARGRDRLTRLPATQLAAGPGLVCAAFSVTRADDGTDLCDPASALRLETAPPLDESAVRSGPRIGIGYAGEPWRDAPWRFWLADSRAVSGPQQKRREGQAR